MIANLYADHDLVSWERAGRRGERPGLGPYGIEYLTRHGITLTHWTEPRWLCVPGIRRLRSAEHLTGLPIVRTAFSNRSVRRAHVTVAMLEQEGYGHAWLKRNGVSPWSLTPLALLTCWLAEEVRTASPAKLKYLRSITQGADLLIFWSTNQRQIFQERLGVPDDRLFFVPFGIETEFYRPRPPGGGNYVFAIGRDAGRDYQTFVAAIASIDFPVKIACPRDRLAGVDIPSNLEVLGEVEPLRYRELLYGAAVVVIPSRPAIAYPTGQSVLLHAMSCQRPTVVTATSALADYARHGENTWTVAGEDSGALRDGIEQILGDDARAAHIAEGGRRDVVSVFNAETMWGTIAARLQRLVNH
jgi:glycosyltransferase involved in cell wall biosynthesis